jgi:hypothetical protein
MSICVRSPRVSKGDDREASFGINIKVDWLSVRTRSCVRGVALPYGRASDRLVNQAV